MKRRFILSLLRYFLNELFKPVIELDNFDQF